MQWSRLHTILLHATKHGRVVVWGWVMRRESNAHRIGCVDVKDVRKWYGNVLAPFRHRAHSIVRATMATKPATIARAHSEHRTHDTICEGKRREKEKAGEEEK